MKSSPQKQITYTQVIEICIPASSKWQPKISEQLVISLFSISEPMNLIIEATQREITWQIETAYRKQDAIVKLIYGIYPQALIKVFPKTNTAIGSYRFNFELGKPFIYPLMSAFELSDLDPLAALTSALGLPENVEQIRYEVQLRPVRDKYLELGEKLADQELESNDKRSRRVISKLQSPLKEADIAVKIRTKEPRLAHELIGVIQPTVAVFKSETFNFLAYAQENAYSPVLTAQEVAALWHLPTEHCKNPLIKWAGGGGGPPPPPDHGNEEHIVLGVNSFQGKTQIARLAYKDRDTHVNILGRTKVGKSTLMHHMIHQDIIAGKGVGVIDPHGSLIDDILRSSIPGGREKDVVLLDVGDKEYPVGLNLLKAPPDVPPEEVASQTVSVIRKMFEDTWSGTRMETVLYAALITLMSVEDSTIQDVERLFHDSDYRNQLLNKNTDPVALQYWLNQYEPSSAGLKLQISSPLTSRLSKFYRNPIIRRIVCQQPSLDFTQVLNQNSILLVNLGGLLDIEAKTLGALLISKLQIAAMSRSRIDNRAKDPFYLYIDEVQNFATTSLPVLFSEARKFGLSLVVANQYFQQLAGDTLEAVFGNVGTNIIFRVGSKDASVVAPFMKPNFTSGDLESMGLYRAIIKTQVGSETLGAFNIQTYAPRKPFDNAEERIERIRALSRAKYARPREEVDAEIAKHILGQRRTQSDSSEPEDEEDSYLG